MSECLNTSLLIAVYIRNPENGDWWVRVEGPHAHELAGQTIPVRLWNGAVQNETLTRRHWQGIDHFGLPGHAATGLPVAIYEIEKNPFGLPKEPGDEGRPKVGSKTMSEEQIANRIAAAIVSNGASEIARVTILTRFDKWLEYARDDMEDMLNAFCSDDGVDASPVEELARHAMLEMDILCEKLEEDLTTDK